MRSVVRAKRPRRQKTTAPVWFIAPGYVLFVLTIAYPVARAVQISLYDWKVLGRSASEFIGLGNYRRAVNDPRFWRGLGNAGVYMAITVPAQVVAGLTVATLLRRNCPARTLFRVLYYLPVVTSWVVVSLLFKYLFADDGLVNYALGVSHLSNGHTSWLSSRWTAMVAIAALGVWKGTGWAMMIFLAALQGVPRELEEAALVDGAGPWRRFRAVTMPAIWPAMLFVSVMLVIGGFNVFTSVLLMTGGGPGGQTDVVLTYMYRMAFGPSLDFGFGSSLAVLLTGFVLLVSLAQMRLMRRRSMSAS